MGRHHLWGLHNVLVSLSGDGDPLGSSLCSHRRALCHHPEPPGHAGSLKMVLVKGLVLPPPSQPWPRSWKQSGSKQLEMDTFAPG